MQDPLKQIEIINTLKTGNKSLRFIMTPHVQHWDTMMIFEETTKSIFTSDLFIQPMIIIRRHI